MENPVVSITNLLKKFPVGGDFFTALKDVNLTLNEGEFLGLVGPSGSGKTTFAKYLSEILKLHDSEVISIDSYYRNRPELNLTQRNAVNYDEPQAIDKPLLVGHMGVQDLV